MMQKVFIDDSAQLKSKPLKTILFEHLCAMIVKVLIRHTYNVRNTIRSTIEINKLEFQM
ncbi:hypothetical protein ACV566_14475 [Staphylococcus aureus]